MSDESPSASERLDELREQLRQARIAVEELAREAPEQRPAAADTAEGARERHLDDDVGHLVDALRALRHLVPEDLHDQLRETIRQLLLLVRGMIDVAVARLEPPDEDGDGRHDGGEDPASADGDDLPTG